MQKNITEKIMILNYFVEFWTNPFLSKKRSEAARLELNVKL